MSLLPRTCMHVRYDFELNKKNKKMDNMNNCCCYYNSIDLLEATMLPLTSACMSLACIYSMIHS